MLQVGITGGIGSGKSLIAKMLTTMGYPVFNSDEVARSILITDPSVHIELLKEFGQNIFSEGKPDRVKIGQLVFHDSNALTKLNGIIHPKVRQRYTHWVIERSTPILFKEAAILVESGNYKELDKLIVVNSPEKLRVKRIMERDNLNEEQVQARINNQLSDEERNKFAGYIINNDEHHPVIPQVLRILDELKQL